MLISVVMGVNLTCVTWTECVTSAVLYQSPNSLLPRLHIRPHLVAINASMASNGYTIWWRGRGCKSLLVIPQCAISEGQGTVHFPQAVKRNQKSILCITP